MAAVIQEVYVHGVSTRSVDNLVKAMVCKIGERVNAFLSRPIRGKWPYLWIDATYLKKRDARRIVSDAVIVAVGVNKDGRREVLSIARQCEVEVFWKGFLRSLAACGLAV